MSDDKKEFEKVCDDENNNTEETSLKKNKEEILELKFVRVYKMKEKKKDDCYTPLEVWGIGQKIISKETEKYCDKEEVEVSRLPLGVSLLEDLPLEEEESNLVLEEDERFTDFKSTIDSHWSEGTEKYYDSDKKEEEESNLINNEVLEEDEKINIVQNEYFETIEKIKEKIKSKSYHKAGTINMYCALPGTSQDVGDVHVLEEDEEINITQKMEDEYSIEKIESKSYHKVTDWSRVLLNMHYVLTRASNMGVSQDVLDDLTRQLFAEYKKLLSFIEKTD